MYIVTVNDFDEWRKQSREFLQREISPNDIAWQSFAVSDSLFSSDESFLSLPIKRRHLKIPRHFFPLAKTVACFRDESRWSLLYSVAWRLLFENRNLLEISIDDQVSKLMAMRKVIARDKHKMEAFVRFRKIVNEEKKEATSNKVVEHFVAWFEPEHLILPLTAPFFMKRFNNMCWSILTPDICAHWDTHLLHYTSGLVKPPDIDDELEVLWLEYYRNIFNPARLKVKAMQSEMPKKYWLNLPEAPLIKDLIRGAYSREDSMIAEGSTSEWSKTAKSKYIKVHQNKLRNRK